MIISLTLSLILLLPQLVYAQSLTRFEAGRIQEHINFLTSAKMAGRYPGSHGDSLAADFIVRSFSKAGLELMFDNGFQPFSVATGVELQDGNKFYSCTDTAVLNRDFVPLSFSASGYSSGSVHFSGYGISVPGRWDDYEHTDVTGKWVMVLAGDPEPDKRDSDLIPHAGDRIKAITASDQGAIGLIVVKGIATDRNDRLMPAFYDKSPSTASIPVINITRYFADKLLTNTGYTIAGLEETMLTNGKPVGFPIPVQVAAQTVLKTRIESTFNVAGILHGYSNKPAVVIGAHYDHLGKGGVGSGSRMPDTIAVHPGADDNASGVAGLIELAKKLTTAGFPIPFDLIFIAFGAEEMGLVGSRYFVQNLPVPKSDIQLMINLDMIGRLSDCKSLSIGGTGTAIELDSLITAAAQYSPLQLQRHPDGYGPSDHAAFYAASFPVLFFTTGAHLDYHTPFDTPDKTNSEGQAMVLDLVLSVIQQMSAQTTSLTFTESGAPPRRMYGRSFKVTLGIIPDITSSQNGLRVDGVRPDGPAGRAGIRKGDLITALNGLHVGNIYEYMARLNTLAAGETAVVELLRDGKAEIVL
ncbi:MAG TPA: M20/M25/M40 family metallo-hydrolase, partial [Bacteroidales bacterium]|nr:M20/M25/M40 family metallo-hydrolase [Bacteroidales bacterium]